MLNKPEIVRSLENLGLKDSVLALHSSYKSIGAVEGGPQTVIAAMKEVFQTLVVPTFYYRSICRPSENSVLPQNNGTSPAWFDDLSMQATPYDGKNSEVSKDMGILPQLLVEDSKSLRGDHPIVSWTALGKDARSFVEPANWLDPYLTLRKLVETKGKVVMLGTQMTSCTLIHLAEEKAGRNSLLRWVRTKEGISAPCRVGSCSDGFQNLWPGLEGVFSEGKVGKATVHIANAGELVDAASDLIKKNPRLTMCEAGCERCQAMQAGGPQWP